MSERQLVRRGNVLPLGEYRTPDGKTEYGYAVPNMLMGFVDAYNALGYAGGLQQDPNAPQGYVSQNALMRGGEGIAGSATLGSFATRAPAGALRAGASRRDLGDFLKYNRQVESIPAYKAQEERNALIGTIRDAMDDVKSGSYAARQDAAARKVRDMGLMPLKEGTPVTPPQGHDMPGNWRVVGYWVDPQNSNRYGYKLANDQGQTFDATVSDPRIGFRTEDPTRFGGGFVATPKAGEMYAPVEPMQNYPRQPSASERARAQQTPEQREAIQRELDDLFGGGGLSAQGRNSQAAGLAMELARNQGREPRLSEVAKAYAESQPGYVSPRRGNRPTVSRAAQAEVERTEAERQALIRYLEGIR